MNDLELAAPLIQGQPEGGNIQLQRNLESRHTLCNSSIEKKCLKLAMGIFGGWTIGGTICCLALLQTYVIKTNSLNNITENLIAEILKIVIVVEMFLCKKYLDIDLSTSVSACITSIVAGVLYGLSHKSGSEKNLILAVALGGLAGGLSAEIMKVSRELLTERNVNRI